MKTFLVPVDFSEISINAAEYAVSMAASVGDTQIILYNVYDKVTFGIGGDHNGEGSRKSVSAGELADLKTSLPNPENLTITSVSEEGSFVSTLEKYVAANKIDLVIIGITGSSRIKQVFMGTNTLNIIRHINIPVMIIPPDAKFTGIKSVVFTSDFKNVAATTPFTSLITILDLFKPQITILNVDSEHYIEVTEEYKKERAVLEDKLAAYDPQFSFLRAFDFLEGINRFVDTQNIDAIITVPKKHNFLSQLFVTSHTKKLAYHSDVPIIAIHG